MNRFFEQLPWRVRERIVDLQRSMDRDPSFIERYHRGEVDENDRPIPRDPLWVARIQSAILSSGQIARYGRRTDRVTRSFLGGSPNLPAGYRWPTHMGSPLTFVAQVDLRELNQSDSLSWLPQTGSLLFFMKVNEADGYDTEISRVLHLPGDPNPDAQLGGCDRTYLTFESGKSYTHLGCEPWPAQADDNADLHLWYHNLIGSEHFYADWQVGGWPRQVQDNDMQTDCELAFRRAKYQSDVINAPEFLREKLSWHLIGQFERERVVSRPEGFSRGFFWAKVENGLAVLDAVRLIGETG